ncbi:branched-chain amino acid transport system ATP-binding protein [Paracoccus isoporae]|uniref:Branched-chain amino acid transport system ATP-binding protein n=1 Tax=Paracoccus isoporae TaxID=591205 RepID=A0A1G6ZKJ9_9RHOB|nr:ABC transporter ATP-binding protein [Paracoccus isoporae]SDE03284.1 branched-chain amino acid transport system ATP-binding protein [Paracoccus isoporae]
MTLVVSGLHAWYGHSHVLQGVDFEVGPGEIVALLGRNGVGRSTTLKALMGDVERRGRVLLDGARIDRLDPHQVVRRGLAYVPEDRQVFPTLTVEQNLDLGNWRGRAEGGWTKPDVLSRFPRLAERAKVPAGALSGGEQQLLSMCRSLLSNPRLMLIDEPTEGLAPAMVTQVKELIVEIAARGCAVLLVEQKLTIALKIASRVLVMVHGQMVFQDSTAAFIAAPEIRRRYLEV